MGKLAKNRRDVHPKGWGYELWIENNEYCGKLLHFEAGKKCSLHFHMEKVETMYLQGGHLQILLVDPENAEQYVVDMRPGDAIKIPQGQMHQLIALEESDLFEFSTTHYEFDSYRVEKGD